MGAGNENQDAPAGGSASGSGERWLARWLAACLIGGVLVAVALAPVGFGVGVLARQAEASVDDVGDRLGNGLVGEATILTDRTGQPFARLYDRYRIPVASDRIANTVKAAVIAVEDRRFLDHGGVDYVGLGRALVRNAASGSPLDGQGASTITMQYVKNYRLYAVADTPAERRAATADTLGRKLTEVRLADRLEDRLTKDQILTRYLNLVYFGHGAYGVEAAARVYFGTGADRLDTAQAALLAGLVRAPEAYDPVDHPDAARERRGTVLAAMTEVRSVTREQAAATATRPLGVVPSPGPPGNGCAAARPGTGHFCRFVLDTLARAGLDADRLSAGGYRIATTLDPAVTARALHAVRRVPAAGDVANVAAFVEPLPERRPLRALVANRPYGPDAAAGESALPLTNAPLRGAGSIYKIFTAAAALEAGLVEPGSRLDVPSRYTSTRFTDGGGSYTVGNYGSYPDELTLRRALAFSPNTPFVALEDRLGSVTPIVDVAWRLGLRRGLAGAAGARSTVGEEVIREQRASFTLGPTPTSPLDLAEVGATITANGRWCASTPLREVRDRRGRPVELPPSPCEQAVSPTVAEQLRSALGQDHTIGTSATAAEDAGWDRPMLGKTGTTQRSASAAFLGATDRWAGAVMTFSDRGAPRPVCVSRVRTCAEGDLTGGSVPARTWYATMTRSASASAVDPVNPPDGRRAVGEVGG